jgi:uncharacterized membrane protein
MEDIQSTLQALQLHPIADHFTVALITVAVLSDLCASLFSQRPWFRYMALTLTVLAAVSAGASAYTGDLEAHRIKDTLSEQARPLLHNHAQLGDILAYAFGALAVVRVGLALFSFMAPLRPFYLSLAVIAVAAVFWQAHWGGQLVFHYGVGTEPGVAAISNAKHALERTPPGLAPGTSTPQVETPTARLTPPAAAHAGVPGLAPSPAPATNASKEAAAPGLTPPAFAGPTPVPAFPRAGITPQPPSGPVPPATPGPPLPPAAALTPGAASPAAPGASTPPGGGSPPQPAR